MTRLKNIILEKTIESFIETLSAQPGPPLYKLSPADARQVLEKLQSKPIEKLKVQIEEKKIPVGPKGEVTIHIVRPFNVSEKLPVIMYFHGGGWILGSFNTHDRLIRELAVGSHAAVVFVDYTRSPEARFPIAIEEAYAATKYIAEQGKAFNLDPSRLAIVGDSVGGNMAIAVTLLAKERKGPKFDFEVLFYPVTNAEFNTTSYHEFAEGPWLTKAAMEWFWNAYEPDTSKRKNPLISPLIAPLEQLKGFPPTLLIVDENDVLRDEGEAFAHRLMQAEVNVTPLRVLGTMHDFAMLNDLAKTPETRAAINLANFYLKHALHDKKQ